MPDEDCRDPANSSPKSHVGAARVQCRCVQMCARRLVVMCKSSGMLFEFADAPARIPERDSRDNKIYRDRYIYSLNWFAYFIRFSESIEQAPAQISTMKRK